MPDGRETRMLIDDNDRRVYGKYAVCPLTNDWCDERCALLMRSEDGLFACALAMIPISDTFCPMPMVEEPQS